MVIVVIGPAGSGKSTVGHRLAERLSWRFVEGDEYHSPENVARMRAGQGLTDDDRERWLHRLHELVAAAVARGEHLVLTCSALKARYRDMLRHDLAEVRFVYLKAPPPVLAARLEQRVGHFAGPDLLGSQLADLEEPGTSAIIIDATEPPDAQVSAIMRALGLHAAEP
jgi:carbohydrate kinase (thermoresistant glucokinase family)